MRLPVIPNLAKFPTLTGWMVPGYSGVIAGATPLIGGAHANVDKSIAPSYKVGIYGGRSALFASPQAGTTESVAIQTITTRPRGAATTYGDPWGLVVLFRADPASSTVANYLATSSANSSQLNARCSTDYGFGITSAQGYGTNFGASQFARGVWHCLAMWRPGASNVFGAYLNGVKMSVPTLAGANFGGFSFNRIGVPSAFNVYGGIALLGLFSSLTEAQALALSKDPDQIFLKRRRVIPAAAAGPSFPVLSAPSFAGRVPSVTITH